MCTGVFFMVSKRKQGSLANENILGAFSGSKIRFQLLHVPAQLAFLKLEARS